MSDSWEGYRMVPEDVLFFRDGKPATLGADHYLRSLFPPFPSTLYGAIRTRRLLDERVDIATLDAAAWSCLSQACRDELGEWQGFGRLEMRGPWFVRGDSEVLLPASADLGLVMRPREAASAGGLEERTGPRHEDILRVVRYRRSPDQDQRSWSHPLALSSPYAREGKEWRLWRADAVSAEPTPASGWYLDESGTRAWMTGSVPPAASLVHHSELWLDEVRTGLGMQSDRRQAEESMLYTFGYIRLAPTISLGFEVRHNAARLGGHLRLGGDGKIAEVVPGPGFPFNTPPEIGENSCVVAFLTPALSASGAFPPGFAADRLMAKLGGADVTLQSAFVRAGSLVGGWDLARRGPKPLRRAIPAGSVFSFGAASDLPAAVTAIHGSNICDYPEEHLAQQGFGLALVGAGT